MKLTFIQVNFWFCKWFSTKLSGIDAMLRLVTIIVRKAHSANDIVIAPSLKLHLLWFVILKVHFEQISHF